MSNLYKKNLCRWRLQKSSSTDAPKQSRLLQFGGKSDFSGNLDNLTEYNTFDNSYEELLLPTDAEIPDEVEIEIEGSGNYSFLQNSFNFPAFFEENGMEIIESVSETLVPENIEKEKWTIAEFCT